MKPTFGFLDLDGSPSDVSHVADLAVCVAGDWKGCVRVEKGEDGAFAVVGEPLTSNGVVVIGKASKVRLSILQPVTGQITPTWGGEIPI